MFVSKNGGSINSQIVVFKSEGNDVPNHGHSRSALFLSTLTFSWPVRRQDFMYSLVTKCGNGKSTIFEWFSDMSDENVQKEGFPSHVWWGGHLGSFLDVGVWTCPETQFFQRAQPCGDVFGRRFGDLVRKLRDFYPKQGVPGTLGPNDIGHVSFRVLFVMAMR